MTTSTTHLEPEQPAALKADRTYEELKMTGPPLYNQGAVSEDTHTQLYTTATTPIATQPLDASRTALLIVDVQPEYWSECPAVRKDFPQFPSRISSTIDSCRQYGAKEIIWVRADYSFERSPWLQQFSRLHQGEIPPIVKPSSEWESFAEPLPDEFVMTKTSWSSTSDTRLLEVLKASGIDTVLVCGLITSVCVQHSAFGIFEAGYRTILVTDACADRGRARHEAALALYGDYMYELRTVESVAQELQAGSTETAAPSSAIEVSQMVQDSIAKSRVDHSLNGKSTSSGSLSTLETTMMEDDEEETTVMGKESN